MAGECKKVCFMKKEENLVSPEAIVAFYWGLTTLTRECSHTGYTILY